jgi:hypothetical protein
VVDPFEIFIHNTKLAKALLEEYKLDDRVMLADLKIVKKFVRQVKGALPFLPQHADLVSPTDRILSILSNEMEQEIIRWAHDADKLLPRVILVFSLHNLNAFLQARLDLFKKCWFRDSGFIMPIEEILSIPNQEIHRVLHVQGELLQELKQIVATTQSIVHGNDLRKSQAQMTSTGNLMLYLEREDEPTAGQVSDAISNMEEFAKLVNETWLASR